MIKFGKKESFGIINYETDWMWTCCQSMRNALQRGDIWVTKEKTVRIRGKDEINFCPYCGDLTEIKGEL